MTTREQSALPSVIGFFVGALTFFLWASALGLMQQIDEEDAKIAASQVMACSTVMDVCRAAEPGKK